jgi:hypothetical protein
MLGLVNQFRLSGNGQVTVSQVAGRRSNRAIPAPVAAPRAVKANGRANVKINRKSDGMSWQTAPAAVIEPEKLIPFADDDAVLSEF